MHFYNSIKQAAAVAIGLLLWLLIPACSDSGSSPDLPEAPQLCTVTISLQSSTGMHEVTKADDNPDLVEPDQWVKDDKYERNISQWLVVAYDTEGKLVGAMGPGTYGEGDEDSRTTVSMELPIGTYTFYAFANLETLTNGTNIKQDILAGKTDDTYTTAEDYLKNLSVNVGDIDTKFNTERQLIPMSSYGYRQTVSQSTSLEIPLIRMIGKVKVTMKNLLSNQQPVSVSELSIGNFTKDRAIYLKPYETTTDGVGDKYLEFDPFSDEYHYEHRAPSFPDGKTEIGVNDSYTLLNGQSSFSVGYQKEESVMIYVNESMLASPSGPLTVALTRSQTVGGTTISASSSNIPTDFYFVRRNDQLEIPLVFTDLKTELRFASQRIPIGVLPTTYSFGDDGQDIQVLLPVYYPHLYAGELVVEYQLISSSSNWRIRYTPEDGKQFGDKKYTKAILVDNSVDDSPKLLIDSDGTVCTDETDISLNPDSTDPLKGSFTIRTQELANEAMAKICLTLIVEYGDNYENEIEIPYTIYIQNYQKQTTTEGGNS